MVCVCVCDHIQVCIFYFNCFKISNIPFGTKLSFFKSPLFIFWLSVYECGVPTQYIQSLQLIEEQSALLS